MSWLCLGCKACVYGDQKHIELSFPPTIEWSKDVELKFKSAPEAKVDNILYVIVCGSNMDENPEHVVTVEFMNDKDAVDSLMACYCCGGCECYAFQIQFIEQFGYVTMIGSNPLTEEYKTNQYQRLPKIISDIRKAYRKKFKKAARHQTASTTNNSKDN